MVKPVRSLPTMWVDERRRYPRVKVPVEFRTARVNTVMRPVGDPDLGGLRVSSPTPLRVNEELTVGVVVPSGRMVYCRVRVVWSGRGRQGGHEAGLKVIGAESDFRRVWEVLEEHAEPLLDAVNSH